MHLFKYKYYIGFIIRVKIYFLHFQTTPSLSLSLKLCTYKPNLVFHTFINIFIIAYNPKITKMTDITIFNMSFGTRFPKYVPKGIPHPSVNAVVKAMPRSTVEPNAFTVVAAKEINIPADTAMETASLAGIFS